ncbi:MAG: deoxyribodipyrimidine photo-lyase [Ignavibacteria bacterium]|nr:deoxyribodipyrimidine photo-lyase [Ignavibacteria bacterium]
MIDQSRIRTIRQGEPKAGPVIYWMSRDQRAHDNWALLHAQGIARRTRQPLAVVFCLVPHFLDAAIRQYGFMVRGLEEVESALRRKNIPLILLFGDPIKEIPRSVTTHHAGHLVTDFNPLRISRSWKERIAARIDIPFDEVDTHNIVPCWEASSKLEFGAYTIRPKIKRLLSRFLTEIPPLRSEKHNWKESFPPIDWKGARASLQVDSRVAEVEWIRPGEAAARKTLHSFISNHLKQFAEWRNDPTQEALSNLSPYLHFGQISPQRVALEVRKRKQPHAAIDAFLEEHIVRRELSDNFCFYNPAYDSFEGFPAWAQKTLNEHRKDKREYIYALEQFELARTHDPLWNAAQTQMITTGKMHGFMRMYWAKKILEWTSSPEEALAVTIYLNDRYELDGRDPNGYVGAAWSIGGVHDQAWGERPVFGKVRYMNFAGCKRKFDVDAYIQRYTADRHLRGDGQPAKGDLCHTRRSSGS